MRSTTTFALLVLLAGTGSGCRSTSVQYQREMALLRAEIIDLEDKYYALKSKYERGIDGSEMIINDGVVGSGVVNSPTTVSQYPVEDGQVIYTDEFLEPVIEGDVYYDNQTYIDSPSMSPEAIQASPDSGSIELPFQSAPESNSAPLDTDSRSTESSQSQPAIPDASVGYENMGVLFRDVDRIEILSQGTRGKDVDGIPGDEGIELLVTTVDANQEFVEATGELTVTVRDPLLGEIGKWTFLPKELELFFSRDEFGNRGLLLHLPWIEQMPVSSNIDIRVKMLLNGIEYIATRNLRISPPQAAAPDDAIAVWTASDERWLTAGASKGTGTPTLQASTAPRRPPAKKGTAKTVERPKWRPVR